jgi:hypothetical protein
MSEKVFIVCVDFQTTAEKVKFENSLRDSQYKEYQILMDRVYAVKAPFFEDSVKLRDFIQGKLGPMCSIFVMKTSLDAAWNIMSASDVWLKNNV